MRDLFLLNIEQTKEYKSIQTHLENGESPILVNGLLSSQRAHLAYTTAMETGKKLVMIASNEIEGDRLYQDLNFYTQGQALFLKNEETIFYAIDVKDRKEETDRISTLIRLSKGDYQVLVLSAETLLRRYVPPQYYRNSEFLLEVGQIEDMGELLRRLVSYGYEREARVESPGQISIRGGILDIFVPTMTYPSRLEFFDDEVDSIREFDPLSQKSLEKINKVMIAPARELILPNREADPSENILKEITKKTNEDISYDAHRMKDHLLFEGAHKYIGYLFPEERTDLFSFLPKDSIFVLNEPNRILDKIENYFGEFGENFKQALENGFALKSQGNLLLSPNQMMDYLGDYPLILNSYLPKSMKGFHTAGIVNFQTKEPQMFQGKIPALAEEIHFLKGKGYTVLLVERDKDTLQILNRELTESGLEPVLYSSREVSITPKSVNLIRGRLSEGFIYENLKVAVFTDKEMFGVSKSGTRKKLKPAFKGKKIDSFVDLGVGDYVVHENYGVGRFSGIESKIFDNIRKDYIRIVYHGGDALYVPLSSMDKVQKYIGAGTGETTKLNKLGTSEWKKSKVKAKKAVDEIAQDLILLYAQRRDEVGFQFSKDTPWQREFEALFPYEETTDQLSAIIDMKKDMQSIRPMDRLICGDVGYGKTEVAIRGIFKSVMDSKQVAFLVPTTILAQQHYNSLKERFEGYPIRVEVVSRFKTKKEQEKILEDARKGLVDVLIGTHRILSKDVKFKDLGLLVVDEEQRFGVRHKELLKEFKKNVDVLTLSATPIPRTLHLSLTGIRDMSILEEPPEDRHPIMTYVTEAREGIILDAIEREIARGGQVFFVYNRVETIEKMAERIKNLVPNANIAIAHGQMSSKKLEDIMIDFLEKEYDILLCTTIIETGMDISNANTMIVYDADKMGLSQLYQLRGRVGRASRQAYAYFMYQKDKVLTEISEKRLKAIREFTEFGSGFKIAMRDLEIRGAGNILGERQHGHMAEVGYDLYVKMLDRAIRELQGQVVEQKTETEIELDISAYIPENYIDDEITKMEIYKKIASIESKEDLYDMEEEIEDRFSNIPNPVRNLLQIAYIKALGSKIGIRKIRQAKKLIIFQGNKDEDTIRKDFKTTTDYKLVTTIAEFLEMMV